MAGEWAGKVWEGAPALAYAFLLPCKPASPRATPNPGGALTDLCSAAMIGFLALLAVEVFRGNVALF